MVLYFYAFITACIMNHDLDRRAACLFIVIIIIIIINIFNVA